MPLLILPKSCSRLAVFLSYASEQRGVAEDIAHALQNAGHKVFFDKDSLKPGSDFSDKIRSEIRASDRFVFLLTRSALASGRFTLTELGFAKERWPGAKGAVIPVLLEPSLPIQDIPPYLRSVHILHVEGNAPVEVATAVEATRRLKPKCAVALTLAALLLIAAPFYFGLSKVPFRQDAGFKVLRPDQVDFRPLLQPTAANKNWLNSEVAVSIVPVQYSNMSGRPVRIHDEKVQVGLKGRTVPYKRFNEVEIMPTACPGDWLCTRKGVGAGTIEPGRTFSRDVMFIPAGSESLTWRDFLATVVDEGTAHVDVHFKSSAETSNWGSASEVEKDILCRVDLKQLRSQLEAAGYKSSSVPPSRLTPFCMALP